MGMAWRLMWHINRLVKEGSPVDVARSLGLSVSSVRRTNKTVPEMLDFLIPTKLNGLDAIVVDGKHLGRKLGFITVISDKYGELLYIGKGKGKSAIKGFLDILSEEQKAAVKVVGADRSNAYTKAVEECLPHAGICYDHFHIVKNLNDAVTKVRRVEFKRNDPDSKALKGSKYLLLRNP